MSSPRRLVEVVAVIAAVVSGSACGSSTVSSTAPSPTRCGVNVSAPSSTLPATGSAGVITVTTARECAWTASSEASWLSIMGPRSGQGDGVVQFNAAVNPDPVERRGAVVLNDARAELTQAAGECVIRLRDPSAAFPQAGGGGVVHVIASSSLCTWTASSGADWITITGATSGSGSGAISFQVAATSGPPRTGTIIVSGQRFDVTQTEGCAYAIAPQSHSAGAAGGTGTVTVTTTAGCPWTAGSNVAWITVSEPAAGTGPGSVAFSVAPSAGAPRIGALTVAGQTFTVSQGQGCTFSLSPEQTSVPAAGGSRSFAVQAPAGCGWSAASQLTWITVSSGASGSGNGTVGLDIAPNAGPARTGIVTAGGQTFAVEQAGPCAYSIAPQQQSVGAGGGNVTVGVTAPNGCGWTASSHVPWIAVVSGATGSGTGAVQLAVAANSGAARSGTVTIAGETFTIQQAAAESPGTSCVAGLSPTSRTTTAAGGAAAFTVVAPNDCSWRAQSDVPWIIISGNDGGTGNGRVDYSVQPNTGAPRSGTITVQDRVFTVEQQGG